MSDLAIRVENLSKLYHISALQQRHDTLRDALTSRFRRAHQSTNSQATSSDELWALKDVSFEVKRGEVVGIIGRNGAGKSTLLKILSRITEPTSGVAEIHGRVGSLLEVGTGFHPELTGRENIYLNGAILGMKRTEIDRQFDEIVAFAEIERFLDTPVKRYSSGMYVRLAFAVAAHLEPEILLVDEVLAVGDLEFQRKCLGRMSEVAKEGRTVLFVSHNMVAVQNLCTFGILLASGSVGYCGSVNNCIESYVSSTRYVNGNKWVRDIESKSSLVIQEVIVRIEGSQPRVNMVINVQLMSKSFHKSAFIAVDLLDSTTTVLMQALPSIEPFITCDVAIHCIDLLVELPPMIPGHYSLSIWVGSHNTETLDLAEKCVSFDIVESPTPGRTFPHTVDHGHIVPITKLHYSALSN